MILTEYKENVKRTMADLGSTQNDILHMLLGMNAEFSELYEATDSVNAGEELTDICWFATNYCNIKGIKMRDFDFIPGRFFYALEKGNYHEMLQVAVSKLTDLEKKVFAYKKQINEALFEEAILQIFQRLNDSYAYCNIDPLDSMQKNIDKLKARYPDKFTEEKANNRDLITERKILEGK